MGVGKAVFDLSKFWRSSTQYCSEGQKLVAWFLYTNIICKIGQFHSHIFKCFIFTVQREVEFVAISVIVEGCRPALKVILVQFFQYNTQLFPSVPVVPGSPLAAAGVNLFFIQL